MSRETVPKYSKDIVKFVSKETVPKDMEVSGFKGFSEGHNALQEHLWRQLLPGSTV